MRKQLLQICMISAIISLPVYPAAISVKSGLYKAGMLLGAAALGAVAYRLISSPHLFTREWTVDKRHILQSWPRETVAWLRKHEVTVCLKKQLDTLIAEDASVLTLFSRLYQWRSTVLQLPSAEGMSTAMRERQRIIAELEKKGFRFFKTEVLYNGNIVFGHSEFPNYVFKISSDEVRNMGRLSGASFLSSLPQLQNAVVRSDQISAPIIIPKKYVYIMPFPQDKNISYKNIPKVIIVAPREDKVGNLKHDDKVAFHEILQQNKECQQTCFDDHADNFFRSSSGFVIIDTENIKNPPGFLAYKLSRKQNDIAGEEVIQGECPLSLFPFHLSTIEPENNGLVSYKFCSFSLRDLLRKAYTFFNRS